MITKKTIFLLQFIALFYPGYGQNSDYILKRESFREALTTIQLSPGGENLLAGFMNGSFGILDARSFEIKLMVDKAHYQAVYGMAICPGTDTLLTAGDNYIKLWTTRGEPIAHWRPHATTIWNLDISRDGKYAVSSEFNKTFRLWDVSTGEMVEQMKGHDDVTMAVAFSPDSKFIASGSNDRTVRIWDIAARQVIKTLHGPADDIYDVKFSPDGNLVAVASKDRSVRIYHIREEKMVHLLKGHRDFVIDVEFSPDGHYLISASADQSIILWDLETGERIYAYLENKAPLLDILYHPDGTSFFSTSLDGDLTHWAVHPEIFVLKYFEKPYLEEISASRLFDDRRQGESRKDYDSRMVRAGKERAEIIDRYYREYLKRFE